jgi:hypothetical protein
VSWEVQIPDPETPSPELNVPTTVKVIFFCFWEL